jgi:hypothetical protein
MVHPTGPYNNNAVQILFLELFVKHESSLEIHTPMKTLLAFAFFAGLTCVFASIVKHRSFADGFDAGRADVVGQLQSAVTDNSNQWVNNGKFMYERLPGNVEYISREYTNRFFTNWVLRVRQP